jgi:hypothetical protein
MQKEVQKEVQKEIQKDLFALIKKHSAINQ